ncbi:hypothetical protein [Leisingera thetidis]|uniref:hypothetical protein n=1 Tax=Leisingera thetidis TaxID=2930199 RepID=UPI0021F7A2A4|nr:hypothetical protein [Leisingera thetidis]
MTVKRIVPNIAASSVGQVREFYSDLFGLSVVMDHGWIVTLASGETAQTQISIASEGGRELRFPISRSRSKTLMLSISVPRTLGTLSNIN